MTSRSSLLTGTSLIAFSLACANMAHAQSTADLVELDEIVVEGSGDTNAPVKGYVADLSGTATKSAVPILEVPQSVSVITGDQIEDQGATSLGDTLGYTAGITAKPYGNDPRFDAPTIRGFNGANAQYLNGLRILRSMGAPSFEIYSTERIEVLKGPASVLYGSGIPGGVINQIQKRAYGADFGEAGIGIGSPKANEVFLDWNKVLSDDFSARVTAVARDSEEDISELKNTRGYLGLATRWTPQDGTEIQFLGSYQKDSPVSPTNMPYDLVQQYSADYLRDIFTGDPAVDESDRKTANIGFELKQDLAAGWGLNAAFRYQKLDWDYDAPYVSNTVSDGDTISRGVTYVGEESSTADIDIRLNNSFTLGATQHEVLLGAEIRRYESKDYFAFASMDSLSLSNPVYDGGNVGAVWWSRNEDLTLDQKALYAQDEISWGNWRGSFALRHDWAKQTGTSTARDIDLDADQTTGRAGMSYVFANGLAPYLSYATSFDMPDYGSDIDGNALKPTKGKQWEAGVKYQPSAFNGFFTAAVYDLRQTNMSAAVVENGISGTRQIGEARSRGIELEGTAELAEGWTIRAAYAWNDTEQLSGDNAGAELANAPEHNASLWLSHDFAPTGALAGLTVSGGIRYIGERYGDVANAYKIDDVTLVDLQAAYALNADTQLSLNISNVTDKAYVATCGGFGCSFGEGRTVQARLSYKW